MGTLAKGRKALLSKNGYQYIPGRKAWYGPNGRSITDNEARHNPEVWLENTIRQQQGQVIR
jgi:hypothetical protein